MLHESYPLETKKTPRQMLLHFTNHGVDTRMSLFLLLLGLLVFLATKPTSPKHSKSPRKPISARAPSSAGTTRHPEQTCSCTKSSRELPRRTNSNKKWINGSKVNGCELKSKKSLVSYVIIMYLFTVCTQSSGLFWTFLDF